jgi:H+/Cl- antiporter ClcA
MQNHIRIGGKKEMFEKITDFFREYILFFSIILTIVGLFVFFMGVFWHLFREFELGFYSSLIKDLGEWNTYLLIIGFIVLITGAWYLYVYLKNKKFILEEIETKKRSEFLKKHVELKNTVKQMPKKFQKMVKDKEKELKIK